MSRWITPTTLLLLISGIGIAANAAVWLPSSLWRPIQTVRWSPASFRSPSLSSSSTDLPDLIERVNRSVLKIQAGQELGTGYVVKDGYVLTNAHVIKGGSMTAFTHTGARVRLNLVGVDSNSDVALLRLANPNAIAALPFGNSNHVRTGDFALTIGMPMEQDYSATIGIISGTRRINASTPGIHYLQTDAAINPGNSGGPLLNRSGQVIGMTTSRADQAQNIGFALPINDVIKTTRKILAKAQ